MTTETTAETTLFLSVKKITIYLVIALLGLLLKQIDQPGNTLFLVGTGLLFGHLCYRSAKYKEKLLLRSIILLLATAVVCCVIVLKFNVIPATAVFIISSLVSLLIEWKTKFK